MAYQRLGDLLVSIGLLSEDDLSKALKMQKESKKRLGAVLTEDGFISEGQLIEALEMQLGVEFVDLSKIKIPQELAALVPRNIARRHNVVPVRLAKDELYLAMSDPLNFVAIEDVKRTSRKRVVPMIAMSAAVERAISSLYGNEGATRAIEEMKREAGDTEEESASFMTTTVGDDERQAPTVRLVNSIIERAVTEHASDIHLEPRESEMVVRMRIDGVMHNLLTVPKNLQFSTISRLKVMSSLDIAERKVPQDGRANVRVKDMDIDCRVATLPTIFGEKMVIRLLDRNSRHMGRAGIGLTGSNLARFDEIMRAGSGVVLITGPTGSGKSSTMYTMLGELNTEERNVMTLEDPVEYNIPGINQCQINEKTGMTFAGGLRAILRQDPDVIAVGEIRDGETGQIAMRAAITGHLVLSTIHTSDAATTIDRLFDIGIEPYLVASAVKGIIAQRLVRRICPHCRTAYTPDESELALIGIESQPGMQLYRGKGCPMCFHTGYRGRTGVFEILLVDSALRKKINMHAPYDELVTAARQRGMETLAEQCRALVLQGVTTAEEAARTINSVND